MVRLRYTVKLLLLNNERAIKPWPIDQLQKKLEKFLLEKDAEKIEWIEADEACKVLGRAGKELKMTTLSTYVSQGKIPPSFYKTSPVKGKKLFNKNKLIGLDN